MLNQDYNQSIISTDLLVFSVNDVNPTVGIGGAHSKLCSPLCILDQVWNRLRDLKGVDQGKQMHI